MARCSWFHNGMKTRLRKFRLIQESTRRRESNSKLGAIVQGQIFMRMQNYTWIGRSKFVEQLCTIDKMQSNWQRHEDSVEAKNFASYMSPHVAVKATTNYKRLYKYKYWRGSHTSHDLGVVNSESIKYYRHDAVELTTAWRLRWEIFTSYMSSHDAVKATAIFEWILM